MKWLTRLKIRWHRWRISMCANVITENNETNEIVQEEIEKHKRRLCELIEA